MVVPYFQGSSAALVCDTVPCRVAQVLLRRAVILACRMPNLRLMFQQWLGLRDWIMQEIDGVAFESGAAMGFGVALENALLGTSAGDALARRDWLRRIPPSLFRCMGWLKLQAMRAA